MSSLPSLNQQLIRAIIRGETATVESLLTQGADANTTGGVTPVGESNTALMWAATEGYLEIVNLLLKHKADVKVKNAANYTALMYATESNYREVVAVLLDQLAQLDQSPSIHDRNHYGETVLMTMARHGETDLVQRLVSLGAEVNATNKIGDTALYLAVDSGHTYTVKALLDLGGQANTENLGGWTPLMMASARGDLEIMAVLLENGADFRPKNRWGATALSEARQSFRSKQAIELLIRAGAEE
jgi:uncharacterized protein